MDIKQTWARRRVRVNICKVSQGNGDTSTWWTSFDPNDDVIYLDLEWERALNFSRWWKSRSGESTHDIVPGATMTLSWTINFLLSLWRHTQEALLKGLSESTLCLLSIPSTQWKWNSRLNRMMKSFLWPDVLHLSTKHCWLAIWKDSKSEFISQNRWEWQSLADCHSCCSTRVSSHLHTHIGINSINRICGWNVFPITTLSRSLLCTHTHTHMFAPCSHVLTATTCRWCRQCWSLERAASCTSQ